MNLAFFKDCPNVTLRNVSANGEKVNKDILEASDQTGVTLGGCTFKFAENSNIRILDDAKPAKYSHSQATKDNKQSSSEMAVPYHKPGNGSRSAVIHAKKMPLKRQPTISDMGFTPQAFTDEYAAWLDKKYGYESESGSDAVIHENKLPEDQPGFTPSALRPEEDEDGDKMTASRPVAD